jgi:hypothetical protein
MADLDTMTGFAEAAEAACDSRMLNELGRRKDY